MNQDRWRRQFPTSELHTVLEAIADLVADRVAERLQVDERPTIERIGYSPAEAGEALGCSESTILRRIDDGTITATKMGGRVIIHRDELDRIARGAA